MEILWPICFTFVVYTTTACVVPPLARNLYPSPTITSPKDEENVSRDKIKVTWTAVQKKASLSVLDGLPYKLQIRGPDEKVDDYKTKNLFVSINGVKYSPGQYQARVAASGFFGTGTYSKVVQFNIVNGTELTASPKSPNGDGKNPENPKVPGGATGKDGSSGPSPEMDHITFTDVPQLLEPKTGDKVGISDIFFEWTQVKNAKAYKVELTSNIGSEVFELTKSRCNDCKPKDAGTHKVKVAAIVDGKVGEWGPEVTFDVIVINTLSGTKIRNPFEGSSKNVPVEFEWSKVSGAKAYNLQISTTGRPIKVETWMNFYTFWNLRDVGFHTAKVMGFQNFKSGPWSPEIKFYCGPDPTGAGTRPAYVPGKHRPAPVYMFNFHPVDGEWMEEKCRELSSLNCAGTGLQRGKIKEIPINSWKQTKPSMHVPNNADNFYVAISYVMTNVPRYHGQIRKLVCNEVKSNEEKYVREGTNFAQHVAKHGTGKPSSAEISATANLLQTTIWVFGYLHPLTWVDFQPRTPKYNESIFLIYKRSDDSFAPVFQWK